jgi:SagB-type dehydrogenase family enzyme
LVIDWRAYHEATKHTPERLRRSARALDWANMPNPFRHYDGVPVVDLPADPPSPPIAAWDVLRGAGGSTSATNGADFLSQLFFYSAAISATKLAPATGSTYSLRVNPSSGNLHPTEFHFATRGVNGWADGLYHYRPSQHMAEQRAQGDLGFEGSLVLILTSIAWREAWKYRDRAYRYCLLDIGHAWQAVALAARALGCRCTAEGAFDDAALATRLGLAADEWPMLILTISGPGLPLGTSNPALSTPPAGTPNSLSAQVLMPDLIPAIHAATSENQEPWQRPDAPFTGAALGGPLFGDIVRQRRSALDFIGGTAEITIAQLLMLLSVAREPLLTLYIYVHRVTGLEPGLYRFTDSLERVKSGDQRVVAAGLSLGQNLAGNACIALSIVADLEGAAARYGNRGYRYAHIEAGAVGHRLYIAAEALALRATGIGAFFDDRVSEYLDLQLGQVIYHFAIGYPVVDPRLEP